MKLIIGGYAQGKLDYVREHFSVEEKNIHEACLPPKRKDATEEVVVVNRLNQWLLSLEKREEAGKLLEETISAYRNLILITEEVGNGIVPMTKEDRQWRDDVGALQVELAQQADEVIRVLCKIGQKIK